MDTIPTTTPPPPAPPWTAEDDAGPFGPPDPQPPLADWGRKDDRAKAPVLRGAIAMFPLAMRAVAACSAYGAKKYSWDNWQDVPDGVTRYGDALVRHLMADQDLDEESGLPHAAHAAWNALARLELILRGAEK